MLYILSFFWILALDQAVSDASLKCQDRVVDPTSFTFLFSFATSFISTSTKLVMFLKEGPIGFLPPGFFRGGYALIVLSTITMLLTKGGCSTNYVALNGFLG